MPRAGPCQPTREAATRVSDSAVVTPGCTRSPTGQREDWASLRAWVRARCRLSVLPPGARLQGCPSGGLPVEGPSDDSLVAALWAVLRFRRLLRGACSLEALAADVAPGKPERIKHTRGGPSFSSAH